MAPKFLNFEELVRDHERLCAEVEELKKAHEEHVHKYQGSLSGVTMNSQTPKPGVKKYEEERG